MSSVDHSKPLKTAGLDVFDVVALVEYHVLIVIAEPDQRGKSYNPAPEKQIFGAKDARFFFARFLRRFKLWSSVQKSGLSKISGMFIEKRMPCLGGGGGTKAPLFSYTGPKKKHDQMT